MTIPTQLKTEPEDLSDLQRLVLVTGPSGAGRSTAVNALEDIGFEAIDNIPLTLVPNLLGPSAVGRPLALGIDVRNRDFSTAGLIDLIDTLSTDPTIRLDVLYLDCDSNVLQRRYSETRRRHPLAPAETPGHGIIREKELLIPIKARANVLIETSELSPHQLRAEVEKWLGTSAAQKLAVSVQSFSYKRGTPRAVDIVMDCRFLQNPYWEESLRDLDGRSDAVADYVASDKRFEAFFANVLQQMNLLLPAFAEEGKSHLSIAFGCTGGRHRSVAVAEKLANALAALNWQVSKRHRELERMDMGVSPISSRIGDLG